MAELGSGGKQLDAGFAVARSGTTLQPEHGQREYRSAVAAVRGKFVPLGGFDIVLRNAEAAGIDLAKQRHRLGVALLFGAMRRQRESREVKTALEGGIRGVG